MEISVGLLLSGFDFSAVRTIGRFIKCCEKVLRVNADCLSTFLAETERSNREGFDSICLNASTWVNYVVELLHDLVNVIGVPISRD